MNSSNLLELPLNCFDVLTFCNLIRPIVANYVDTSQSLRKILFVGKGWRLTKVGSELLAENFKPYKSKNKNNEIVTGRILLYMDLCCEGPWSILGDTVTVFNPTIHFEMQLVNGDINAYINFKSPKD